MKQKRSVLEKSCRECNLYITEYESPHCLACEVNGFIEIEKIKDALSYGNCQDFKSRKRV